MRSLACACVISRRRWVDGRLKCRLEPIDRKKKVKRLG